MSKILLGKGQEKVYLNLNTLNRHGIIAGATGTGKTITLKIIAEQLSQNGVPVFLSDIKGDLGSVLKAGTINKVIENRINTIGIDDFEFNAYPTTFFDVFGEEGINIRTTISDMGPIMLTRLMGLNDTQFGVLSIAFEIADQNNWELDDLKDLRALLNYVNDNSKEISKTYGNISSSSIGAILRSILVIEQQGGNYFFGEPAFNVNDLLNTTPDGKGIINILNSKKLMLSPQLYATFLFWLLSELFENLPEVGDIEKPKLVFFFDEAHVLFTNDNKVLLEKIELLVRLIRSKGVGIFFVTQNPTDIPDNITSQLGTKIQHALRAFSPKELKDVKAISETFRAKDGFDVKETIVNLGIGEAVVSTLTSKGIPTFVDKVLICPPRSLMSVVDMADVMYNVNHSPLYSKYNETVDSFSAYEALQKLENEKNKNNIEEKNKQSEKSSSSFLGNLFGSRSKKRRRTDTATERLTKNLMSSVGREVGRQIIRGIFGTLRR